jgi:hypothetical protein
MKNKKCPICDWEIKDAGKQVMLSSGAVVIVCCDDCATKAKVIGLKTQKRD